MRQHLFDPLTKHRPVILLHIKVAAQIEQRELTYLAVDALATNEAIGEIGFTGGKIASSGATDKHAREHTPKQFACGRPEKLLWHYKTTLRSEEHTSELQS